MITDQQNINIDDYDIKALPSKIEIIFIQRGVINNELKKSNFGRLTKLLSRVDVTLHKRCRHWLGQYFFTQLLNKKIDLNKSNLILFNDRNKITKIFKLFFVNYSIIEDGLSNYRGVKFNFIEKYIKKITSPKQDMRYIGDSTKCTKVYLLNAEKSPAYLQHKSHNISFINDNLISQYCLPFFKVSINESTVRYIIATQPMSSPEFVYSGTDIITYKKVAEYLKNKGVKFAFKVHPRENTEKYANIVRDVIFIDSKIPLELVILNNPEKAIVISLYSTAGMGFEKYCDRITLIKDEEVNFINDILVSWKDDINMIEKRITDKLEVL